jgi:hypothetical protein
MSGRRPLDTQADRVRALKRGVVGWLVPGAAHVLEGQWRKGIVFFVALTGMFVLGLAFGGRLFPMAPSDPLVLLAAIAQWLNGLPRIVAVLGGFGDGHVVSLTYEYGNTFLIAGGLLNALVALDAYDLAIGRKPR